MSRIRRRRIVIAQPDRARAVGKLPVFQSNGRAFGDGLHVARRRRHRRHRAASVNAVSRPVVVAPSDVRPMGHRRWDISLVDSG